MAHEIPDVKENEEKEEKRKKREIMRAIKLQRLNLRTLTRRAPSCRSGADEL